MLNKDFIKRTKELLGDEYEAFEESLETSPPVSIRINPRKTGKRSEQPVKWCETGYYLPERPSFTFDPLFHAGTYYVQEAASMFLEQAFLYLVENKNVTCLDLCAAPGGKSTHLISLLSADSLLVSNEVIRSRSLILAENMAKWGYPNSLVTNSDPKDFGKLKNVFDVVVADLPCSGEGLFRKDPTSRDEWSVANVELCAARQRRIVHDVWDALKPGGYLVYSTCTFNTEENEDNVLKLSQELDAEIITIPVKPEWNITGSLKHDIPVYRFFPHKTWGEGFFMAVFRKKPDDFKEIGYKSKLSKTASPLQDYLLNPEKFVFQNTSAIPEKQREIFGYLSDNLNVINQGIQLGEWKGRDFIPSAALALSTELNREKFPNVELSYNEAIQYLRKETLNLSAGILKGFILVHYQNVPLGFMKNIGNRANNLYPKEWRIRK
ncbi:MAG: rRNA cytosine-C5-methyltransferase [Tannerella sp.]|jgi:16S rRNA C967 or C1407 C5-methylase (RsmB/RsmF family)/NOL1/NOP2/fmu family ribosome biogenesis protein|nr:rRNA cytosine-C5-methyltransferase [Tannerella sp.]